MKMGQSRVIGRVVAVAGLMTTLAGGSAYAQGADASNVTNLGSSLRQYALPGTQVAAWQSGLEVRPSNLVQTVQPARPREIRKNMFISSLLMIGGGIALTYLAYGDEAYTFTYCPGCRPQQSTTLYRETYSGSIYWAGIGTASAGGVMMVYSLMR